MKLQCKYLIITLLSSLALAGCSYLDFDETNAINSRESMYEYFARAKGMLTNVYSNMPQGFNPVDGAMRDCASDDAEYAKRSAGVQLFNNGNWSSIQTVDTQWGLYSGIRKANEFIESISEADFSRFEHNSNYEIWKAQLKYFPYEARMLRAYYFFELSRRYGAIAMPLKMLTSNEANTIHKTPFEEVIKFIVSECDECAMNLPYTYDNEPMKEVGRITKGFAMALKTKALLYAASLLHNPSNDVEKWRKSARSALDLINLVDENGKPVYMLDGKLVANNLASKEIILFKMNGNNSRFELDNFPFRFTEGQRTDVMSGTYPTQNLVDEFQTINGYNVTLDKKGWISLDPDFNPQRPYEGRDPRFARTVIANGMPFKGSSIELQTGGLDNIPASLGGTPTGYFIRKYIQESTSFVPSAQVTNQHHWVVFRLSEAYLTFAEAMIQIHGDPRTVSDEFGAGKSALWALNEVRLNAGMPKAEQTPAYKDIDTKDGFMEALRNEWRVEFAFEDHRFWDIRRWKIADQVFKESIDGVSIDKSGDGLKFSRVKYRTRIWNDKMNLYPIPMVELYKNSNLNPQNVGW